MGDTPHSLMAPLQKHTKMLDKTTTHLETQIQPENSPVPDRRELKAIAENQDGNLMGCEALRPLIPPARRKEGRYRCPSSTLGTELGFDIHWGAREGPYSRDLITLKVRGEQG